MLVFEQVDFAYGPGVVAGKRTVTNCSFSLKPGEIFCVVGPSGSGKTTVLKLASGLLKPSSGRVTLRGEPVAPRKVAVAFQEASLLEWLDAVGNVTVSITAGGGGAVSERQRSEASECLERLGLSQADMKKRPGELSVGMQARVSLARALYLKRSLLVLDEPFAALDFASTAKAISELNAVVKTGCAIVLVTHDIRLAAEIADKFLLVSLASPTPVEATALSGKPRAPAEAESRYLKLREALVGSL